MTEDYRPPYFPPSFVPSEQTHPSEVEENKVLVVEEEKPDTTHTAGESVESKTKRAVDEITQRLLDAQK